MSPRPQNPILARLAKKQQQSKAYRASKKLEKGMAKRVGGYTTAGSGNKLEKGDVRKRGVLRIEHKATSAASFSVKREMLEKLELAARGCDEVPILVVDFLNDRGMTNGTEFAILPLQDLLDLIDAAQKPDR